MLLPRKNTITEPLQIVSAPAVPSSFFLSCCQHTSSNLSEELLIEYGMKKAGMAHVNFTNSKIDFLPADCKDITDISTQPNHALPWGAFVNGMICKITGKRNERLTCGIMIVQVSINMQNDHKVLGSVVVTHAGNESKRITKKIMFRKMRQILRLHYEKRSFYKEENLRNIVYKKVYKQLLLRITSSVVKKDRGIRMLILAVMQKTTPFVVIDNNMSEHLDIG